jgi:hypothetical protein
MIDVPVARASLLAVMAGKLLSAASSTRIMDGVLLLAASLVKSLFDFCFQVLINSIEEQDDEPH